MKTTEQIEHDKNLRRVVVSSLVGAVIEWYDFFLYGVVAGLIFNHLYFPEFDDRIGTMLAFATFAVGFVARPLGGLVFGHFGDKIGRKKVLVLTLMIMGTGTVAIGCIPSYASIGIWAPILLILCRVAQGLGLGGEWGGAVLMSFESAPAHKRAFYASLPQIGLSLGLLLASGVIGFFSAVLSNESFISWGWRIAFIMSAGLLFVGSYIRSSVHETKDFSEAKAKMPEVKYPLLDAFKRYPKMMVACMGARLIDGVAFNTFAVFSLSYLTQTRGLERSSALAVVMIACAASSPPSSESDATASSIPFLTVSIGSWVPIRPVEETTTSFELMPSLLAASTQVASAFEMPVSPVQAFALPELMTAARIVSQNSTRLRQT